MKYLNFHAFNNALRRGREAFRGGRRAALAGQFQIQNHTLPDRYPWLFEFAAEHFAGRGAIQLLSFGCSHGDEVFSLRKYLPTAAIKGMDIDPQNIQRAVRRAVSEHADGLSFAVASTTTQEPTGHYDAVFCLAVLCRGDLTATGASHCDPHMYFADFERQVTDFARCLKPGGFLFLHTTNFRFCDTAIAAQFEVALEAAPAQLAPDLLFDRNNQVLPGARYFEVGFRKRHAPARAD
jgi:SAM-dependent methyltransferase